LIHWIEKLGKVKLCFIITIFAFLFTQVIVNIIYFISNSQISMPGRISSCLAPILIAPAFSWWFIGLLLRIQKLEKEMREIATYDCLTKLYSRNAIYITLENLLQLTKRTHTSLVLLYIDIDYFKNINDSFGHDTGDMVLRQFGTFLKSRIRESDVIGRIGGEEFVIGLPDTGFDDGLSVAEKI
jgi:predicted signal transduction protein with EAL and GGDEF domain